MYVMDVRRCARVYVYPNWKIQNFDNIIVRTQFCMQVAVADQRGISYQLNRQTRAIKFFAR